MTLGNALHIFVHTIVTHFSPDANSFFAKCKNFFAGVRIRPVMRPKIFQNPAKTGRKSFPIVHSHTTAPMISPAIYPSRRSASQTANPCHSQAKNAPMRNNTSPSSVCLGRSGRRKPYRSPSPTPSSALMPNRRTASAGAVIRRACSPSCRCAGLPHR